MSVFQLNEDTISKPTKFYLVMYNYIYIYIYVYARANNWDPAN